MADRIRDPFLLATEAQSQLYFRLQLNRARKFRMLRNSWCRREFVPQRGDPGVGSYDGHHNSPCCQRGYRWRSISDWEFLDISLYFAPGGIGLQIVRSRLRHGSNCLNS